mgnify:CR=1 FL=1
MSISDHESSDIWVERLPKKSNVVRVHLKSIFYWSRNNSPYLSGDVFADNADFNIFAPRFRSKIYRKQISEAQVVFCPSNRLEEAVSEFKGLLKPKVLICGNSDRNFYELPYNLPSSIKLILLQNSFISDNKRIFTLPIGVENIRWGVNGHPKNITNEIPWSEKINKVLVGPFGLTNETRFSIRELKGSKSPEIEFKTNRLTPFEFNQLAQKYKFVAAVEGNGVDTHRLWESFYRGSFVFIKDNNWSRSLEWLQLPFSRVADWSESSLTHEVRLHQDFFPQKTSLPALWWSFWNKLIQRHA